MSKIIYSSLIVLSLLLNLFSGVQFMRQYVYGKAYQKGRADLLSTFFAMAAENKPIDLVDPIKGVVTLKRVEKK